jgi:hypothetical protein
LRQSCSSLISRSLYLFAWFCSGRQARSLSKPRKGSRGSRRSSPPCGLWWPARSSPRTCRQDARDSTAAAPHEPGKAVCVRISTISPALPWRASPQQGHGGRLIRELDLAGNLLRAGSPRRIRLRVDLGHDLYNTCCSSVPPLGTGRPRRVVRRRGSLR